LTEIPATKNANFRLISERGRYIMDKKNYRILEEVGFVVIYRKDKYDPDLYEAYDRNGRKVLVK
jgi:hypothetical protein